MMWGSWARAKISSDSSQKRMELKIFCAVGSVIWRVATCVQVAIQAGKSRPNSLPRRVLPASVVRSRLFRL